MKRAFFAFLLAFAVSAFGQAAYSIETGLGAYVSTTPHSAADFSLVIGGSTSSASSFTTFEIRPITYKTPSTTVRSGLQYAIVSSGKVELSGIVQGGGSATSTGTSADFAGGAKVAVYPAWKKAPGLYFAFTGQALGDTSNGWNPQAALWVGYSFSGASSGSTLSTRRKLARLAGGK
jgi:hypothetical protein